VSVSAVRERVGDLARAVVAAAGKGRRRRALEAAVPEALDVLRATVAAGAAPGQGLAAATDAVSGPLREVLAGAVRAHAVGVPSGRALAEAGARTGLHELHLAGEALDLASVTGAPPGPVIAGVASAAADRVRARQARLAATAEARLSVQVIAALGPGFVGVLAWLAPGEISFLVREPAGWLLLAAAAALEPSGCCGLTGSWRARSERMVQMVQAGSVDAEGRATGTGRDPSSPVSTVGGCNVAAGHGTDHDRSLSRGRGGPRRADPGATAAQRRSA
jgi:hypothetical protein